MTLADVNGDGLSDLVVFDTPGGSSAALMLKVGILRGDGTYMWRRQVTTRLAPASGDKVQLMTSDFNGDRRADLLLVTSAANARSGSFTTFLTSGGAQLDFAIEFTPFNGEMPAVSLGDADGDGTTDVFLSFRHDPHGASTCGFSSTYSHASITWVHSRQGRLAFPTFANSCYEETSFLAFADWTFEENPVAATVNGDHWADVFHFFHAWNITTGQETYVLNDLPGPLVADELLSRRRLTDLNGDGRPDWVFATFGNPGLIVTSLITQPDRTRSRQVQIIPSTNGDLASSDAVANWFLADVGSLNTNGEPDGNADLVLIDDARQRIITPTGVGDGTWAPVAVTYAAPNTIRRGHVLTGRADRFNWRPVDVDGDGLSDLVHIAFDQQASGSGTLRVETLLARGDGTWQGPIIGLHFQGAYDDANVHDFMTADIDGDGLMDPALVQTYAGRTIAGAGASNTRIRSLLANGGGTWREVVHLTSQRYQAARGWRPMDVNGDGRTDLAYVSSGPSATSGTPSGTSVTVSYMLSLGDGHWDDVKNTPVIPSPAINTEATREMRVVDLDHDGYQDIVFVANVPGTLPGITVDTGVLVIWNRFPAFVPTITTGLASRSFRTSAWLLAEMNGDDQPELVRLWGNPLLLDVISLPVPGSQMTRTANGMGGGEDITYTTSAGLHRRMPPGVLARMVDTASVRLSDTGPPVSTTFMPMLGRRSSLSRAGSSRALNASKHPMRPAS